jgi:hypothetical protein
MALYGEARDISLFRRINRELMGNIVSQEVIYYKYKLAATKTNMYGEAVEGRTFSDPVILFARIEVGPQEAPVSELGVDFTWTMTFRFLRDDLLGKNPDFNTGSIYGANLHPEVGDVINYQNGYWEVDNTNATQFFMGKDPDYPYYDANGNNPINPGLENFGYNVEVRCDCHYVPSDRLNLQKSRL